MNIKKIVEEALKESVKECLQETEASEIKSGKKIAILQRGWVAVGDFSKSGVYCTLKNAAIIRNWGTTNGLGEIALNGPTEKTKLDKCPDITFHELTAVALMDCVESKWK